MTFLGSLALATAPASACVGFACDNPAAPPVLQAAERIVFGIDPDSGEVEMHVQVSYTGQHEFAWIVPVPEPPELPDPGGPPLAPGGRAGNISPCWRTVLHSAAGRRGRIAHRTLIAWCSFALPPPPRAALRTRVAARHWSPA